MHSPSTSQTMHCFCSQHQGRRGFLLTAASLAIASPAAMAQVDVGAPSLLRNVVPAEALEESATQQYQQLLGQAKAKGELVDGNNAQLQRLRAIAQRIIPYTAQWNERAKAWRWEVNLINSKQINAFCMPGGKIAFYTGIIDQLRLSDDEIAMVMGHEMAHALREHSREQLAKNQATGLGLSLGAQLLGLGDLGNAAARVGTQLLSLKFSRNDESEADLVGLELAARAGFNPQAAVTLWQKMGQATGNNGVGFLSTHPTGPNRIRQLESNVPLVQRLYEQARRR
ncbi:M48 family metallopeptidase [Comamonas aquatilis]|uniref:M48 family metallopeptidase n=1 Tax=Comamonas aquatilis TaxID=1778406 RepID=UPI0039F11CC5